MKMETFKNENFHGKTFHLDEVVFTNCQLTDCDLYYSGGDFEWVGSNFDNCRFHWRGAAKNTLALLQAMGMLKTPTSPNVIPTSQKPN
jgi:hypothetical protein